jgi:hypothetical protein
MTCQTRSLGLNAKLQAAIAAALKLDVIETTTAKPFQISVVWRTGECHCQATRFLLHIYLKQVQSFNSIIIKALNKR